MASTKIQRWLDLIAFLASHRYPVETERLWENVPAYAAGVGGSKKALASVRRTFERDKVELRALGIPIESDTFFINNGEQVDGYHLARKDFHLPYLRLLAEGDSEGEGQSERDGEPQGKLGDGARPGPFELGEREMGAALEGLRMLADVPGFPLRDDARFAASKLSFDLDDGVMSENAVVEVPDAEAERSRLALRTLNDALLNRKQVTFAYHAMARDERASRTAHPFGLVFQLGRWYLVAFDPDRDDMRMFRVGRMSDVKQNTRKPAEADYEVPTDFALSDYTDRNAWELGEDEDGETAASVRFEFPRSLWAERNQLGDLVERYEGGAQLREFSVRRRDPFLRWVLSQAGEASVESPDELSSEYRTLVQSVAALYPDGG